MRQRRCFPLLLFCTAVTALAAASAAAAQGAQPAATSAPFAAFSGQKRDQPIRIEAATLEVRDKSKVATFSGNVIVVQGDTTIRCRTLAVFYGQDDGPSAKTAATTPIAARAAATVPQDARDIRRIEARGDVTVVSKDQKASGDLGVYDLKEHTITLTGNVLVSQGKSVVRGDRVVVDTITGFSRVESSASSPGRVRALIVPQKGGNSGASNVMTFGPARQN